MYRRISRRLPGKTDTWHTTDINVEGCARAHRSFDPPHGGAHDDHKLGRRHCQMAMARAKEMGGRLVQIIVPGGLSPVQQAEADLAEALGIEVVRLDCTQCEGCVSEAEARADGDGGLVGAHGLRQVLKKAMEHGGRRREMDGASRDRRRAARVVEL